MEKLKVSDKVIVRAGRNKGSTGTIKKIFRNKNRVVVSGVNIMRKAIKPTQENPHGGIVDVEGSIHISNVALCDPEKNVPTRVRIESREGKKVRVAVKSGALLS